MQVPSNEHKWLKPFFNTPNEITLTPELTWSNVDRFNTITDEVSAWCELVGAKGDHYPYIVPFLRNSEWSWYACCLDSEQKGRIADELESFLENAYAHIDKNFNPDSTDPCEQALEQRFGKNIIKLQATEGNEDNIVEILRLYRQVAIRRPHETKTIIRPAGRIRYDFEKALAVGDDVIAEKCIEELKLSGRLDRINQRFLEIRRYASFGKWELLTFNAEFLRSVVDLHLPAKIQSDLIHAVYFTFLYTFEVAGDPAGAIKAFQDNILANYAKLFKSIRGNRTPAILKAFLINEIARENPNLSYCQSLLSEIPIDDPGYSFSAKLLELIPTQQEEKSELLLAEEAFEDEKFDLAFNLFLTQEPTKKNLQRILYCIQEIETLESYKSAWNYSQNIDAEIIASLPARSKRLFEGLKKKFSETSEAYEITNWCQLIEFVLNDGDEQQGLEIAEKGSVEWSADYFINNHQEIDSLGHLLDECLEKHPEFFKKSLPSFYTFFFSGSNTSSEFKTISTLLVDFIALYDSWTSSDLGIVHDLLQVTLTSGPTKSEYIDIVKSVLEIFSQVKSPQNLTWILDISELLSIHSSPHDDSRITLFADIAILLGDIKHRVCKEEWATIEFLAKDYGYSDIIEGIRPELEDDSDESGDVRLKLSGKKIGIYTLTEPAGLRAKKSLIKFYSGVSVETNCDHEATEKLINLAKSADIFVFAWKSSKHQAFYCVQTNIQDKDNLIMPLGKGSTSIVRSVTEFVEQRYS